MPDLHTEFEKFNGGPTESPVGRVYVSINKEHVIGINRVCYELLGRPAAVFLHFNRKNQTIAVEPLSTARVKDSFPIKEKTQAGWRINALPFCKFFGIHIDATERFLTTEVNAHGHLFLDLSNTTTIRKERHKRKP